MHRCALADARFEFEIELRVFAASNPQSPSSGVRPFMCAGQDVRPSRHLDLAGPKWQQRLTVSATSFKARLPQKPQGTVQALGTLKFAT